jgi:hypothetical protein
MFLMRDITGMSQQNPIAMRRQALDKEMKEGTQNERRDDSSSGEEGQEAD